MTGGPMRVRPHPDGVRLLVWCDSAPYCVMAFPLEPDHTVDDLAKLQEQHGHHHVVTTDAAPGDGSPHVRP